VRNEVFLLTAVVVIIFLFFFLSLSSFLSFVLVQESVTANG